LSRVTAVQPSASTFTAAFPAFTIGSIASNHALGQAWTAARFAVVGHLRFFVHPLSDAVADELTHHRESVRLDMLLHGVADVGHPAADRARSIAL